MKKFQVSSFKLKDEEKLQVSGFKFQDKLKTKNLKLKTAVVTFFLLLVTTAAFADWTLPVSISSGTTKTNLTIGVSSGATDGYDQGLDSPTPFEGESLNAYFPHPDWGVVVAGTPVDKFHRDIRGGIPQDFYFEILSTVTPVTIKWDTVGMPGKTTFMLYDHTNGIWIDMRENVTYTFNPSVNPNGFTVKATWGDLTLPSSPTGLSVEDKVSSLFITWNPNTESDLAGYKIHLGKKNGTYERTVDIKDVNNYSLLNLSPDSVYYIALTAYDKAGNESPYSVEVSGKLIEPTVTLSVSKSGTGSGTVTSSPSGISCGTDCSEPYATGITVTLNATAATGSTFAGWAEGSCSGTGTCVVTMDSAKSVTATFKACTYSIFPVSQSFPANGGIRSVGVTTQSGCCWTATSNAAWITITSGISGTGSGTVNYSVSANKTPERTGTSTIAGKTFTVKQKGIRRTFTVIGRVKDTFGNPLLDTRVTISGRNISKKAVTDSDGKYSFTDIPAGTYILHASKKGYKFRPVKVTVTGSNVSADIIGKAQGWRYRR